jgi:hypothetical protein
MLLNKAARYRVALSFNQQDKTQLPLWLLKINQFFHDVMRFFVCGNDALLYLSMSIFAYIWQFFFVQKMNTIKNDLRVVMDFPFICHQNY